MQDFGCCLRVSVVTGHNTRSLYRKFSCLSLFYCLALFVDNLCFPAISGFSDCSDFIDIIHAKMYASRSDGFTQTIVCIVFMIWEVLFPVFDQTWWYRLCSNMHQSPLIQVIICNVHFFIIKRKQKILCPRHQ